MIKRIWIICIYAIWTMSGTVNAQEPTSFNETYGAWVLRCENTPSEEGEKPPKNCAVTQDLQHNETGKRLLQIAFIKRNDIHHMIIITPFGLDLTKGVVVIADEAKVMTAKFKTCRPDGCLIPVDVDEDSMTQIAAAENLTLQFTAVNQDPFSIKVSGDGLTSALQRLNEL